MHINSHLFLSNYQVARAARSLKIPFVLAVHGFNVKRNLVIDIIQAVYLRTIARLFFGMASRVICLTETEAANVAEVIGGYEKISVIPNSVDVDLFKQSSEKDPNLMTWIGRLVPEKGLIYLLEAMRKVVKQYADVKLVLIGDGPLRKNLSNFVNRHSLQKNVIFLGAKNHAEVAALLSKSSVFVFPSLKEGMPRALQEAMACGTAVVGANVSGIRDLIRHGQTGILVTPKDAMALSNSLLTLLKDETFRGVLGRNAREEIIKRYDWSSVAALLDKVYSETLAKAKAS